MNVFDRIQRRQQTLGTALCLGLDPRPDWFTPDERAAPNPWFAWGRRLIQATADYICCVKPNSAFYEAAGLAGIEGLRATLAYAREQGLPTLLDAKRGDIGSTAEAYARAAYEWLGADAVTLNPYLGADAIMPFLHDSTRGVFVLCHTSNPSAGEFQTRLIEGRPLFEAVAEQATGWSDRVGLVVGATYPDAIARIRRIAPEAWLLLPGVGPQGGELAAAVAAARTHFIISTSRAIATADDPAAAARSLRDDIQSTWPHPKGRRASIASTSAHPLTRTCPDPGGRDTPFGRREGGAGVKPHPHEQLILDLHRIGAIQFGEFTLASGLSSPIYIDLRLLPSDPAVLARVAAAYANLLSALSFDRLAAIPYAALPIGAAVALQMSRPLIYPRKEIKAHGHRRAVEGHFEPGERVAVLDDLITTGGSKIEAVQALRDAGLIIEDVVVLIDRQSTGAMDLRAHGLRLHAVLTLEQMVAVLADRGIVSPAERAIVEQYLKDH
jgi:uridine monophosphate synthetase